MLRELLRNVREKSNGNVPDVITNALDKGGDITDEVWQSVFDYSGLRRRRRFGHQVETDGVSVCFHFNWTKKHQKQSLKRRKTKQQRTSGPVISVDPGRCNIITAHNSKTGTYYCLTRQTYYRNSGMNIRTKKVQRRLTALQPVYTAMSKAPTKSISEFDWYQYQQIITRNYDKLWSYHTSLASRRDALRVHCLKERCLDRFFNKFAEKGKPTVAYGAVSLNPTGKGELSVPVKYVYKKCCEKFNTVKVNEDYTTKMHHKCEQQTVSVLVRESRHTIRGLRWCPTCRELVSRDKNATRNIEKVFNSDERPPYLCRTFPRAELPSKYLRMKGQTTHRALRNAYNNDLSRRSALVWNPLIQGDLLDLVEDW